MGKTPPHVDLYIESSRTQTGSYAGCQTQTLIPTVQQGDKTMNTKGKIANKESKTEDIHGSPHAAGRFRGHAGRAGHHRHGHVPSGERICLRHHPCLDHRPHHCHIPGLLWRVRPGRALRQAGRKGRLAGPDWLPPVQRLDDTGGILFFHRSRGAAPSGEPVSRRSLLASCRCSATFPSR